MTAVIFSLTHNKNHHQLSEISDINEDSNSNDAKQNTKHDFKKSTDHKKSSENDYQHSVITLTNAAHERS